MGTVPTPFPHKIRDDVVRMASARELRQTTEPITADIAELRNAKKRIRGVGRFVVLAGMIAAVAGCELPGDGGGADPTPSVNTAPSEAPPPGPPKPQKPAVTSALGVYNGPSGERPDEKTRAQFGIYPAVANSYYQPGQLIDIAYETARIRRGTSPNLTITSKGTQYLIGIVNGDPAALAWLDRYVAGLKQLSQVDLSVPVYATLDHEFLSKVNTGAVTGASADPVVYGKALDVFFRKVDAVAPKVVTTYWIVGFDRAFEAKVGSAFTVKPEAILFDPYANVQTDTVATITIEDLRWIRSQPWYKGQLIGLGEFGMPVRHGDEALARFYSDLPTQLSDLGIGWAVMFNRTRDNDHRISSRRDEKRFPQAMAAFGSSLRQGAGSRSGEASGRRPQ
jgi:hypothetical protein